MKPWKKTRMKTRPLQMTPSLLADLADADAATPAMAHGVPMAERTLAIRIPHRHRTVTY
jgi:hypothetical protein